MYEDEIPTVEQAREALAAINKGREAGGLPALEYLDFDDAEPGKTWNCLSARNLYSPFGLEVLSSIATKLGGGPMSTTQRAVCEAVGGHPSGKYYSIPDAIKRITDPFDAIDYKGERQRTELRERLVESGVVEA